MNAERTMNPFVTQYGADELLTSRGTHGSHQPITPPRAFVLVAGMKGKPACAQAMQGGHSKRE